MKISGMVAIVDDLPLGGLPGAVARGHVGDFVRHHAGQFGFGLGLQDQAGVHEEEAARQREGVHFLGIQHLDGEGNLGVGVADQVLPDAVDVLGDDRVVDDLGLALHFLRQLLAESDLLLQGVEIDALADVAIADFLGILLLIFLSPAKAPTGNRLIAAKIAAGTLKRSFISPKTPDSYTIRPKRAAV